MREITILTRFFIIYIMKVCILLVFKKRKNMVYFRLGPLGFLTTEDGTVTGTLEIVLK